MFAAFDNSSLFPSNLDVSQVIGCKLLGAKRNLNLTDPVLVSINLNHVKMKSNEVRYLAIIIYRLNKCSDSLENVSKGIATKSKKLH